jgi:hypothetical protein
LLNETRSLYIPIKSVQILIIEVPEEFGEIVQVICLDKATLCVGGVISDVKQPPIQDVAVDLKA